MRCEKWTGELSQIEQLYSLTVHTRHCSGVSSSVPARSANESSDVRCDNVLPNKRSGNQDQRRSRLLPAERSPRCRWSMVSGASGYPPGWQRAVHLGADQWISCYPDTPTLAHARTHGRDHLTPRRPAGHHGQTHRQTPDNHIGNSNQGTGQSPFLLFGIRTRSLSPHLQNPKTSSQVAKFPSKKSLKSAENRFFPHPALSRSALAST